MRLLCDGPYERSRWGGKHRSSTEDTSERIHSKMIDHAGGGWVCDSVLVISSYRDVLVGRS